MMICAHRKRGALGNNTEDRYRQPADEKTGSNGDAQVGRDPFAHEEIGVQNIGAAITGDGCRAVNTMEGRL